MSATARTTGRPGLEQGGKSGQLGALFHGEAVGVPAGDSLNASGSGGHAGFSQNQKRTGLPGAAQMRAAAKFHGFRVFVRAHAEHAHALAVFFAEQSHGARGQSLLARHFPRRDRQIRQDGAVDVALHNGQFLGGQGRDMRKVKAQAAAVHQGTSLLDVMAERPAQGRVQQMRAGMVAGRGPAAVFVHNKAHFLIRVQLAPEHFHFVRDELRRRLAGRQHPGLARSGRNQAEIPAWPPPSP